MPMDRFLIGPVGGLETDLKPFMIPDEAMSTLDNSYVFRGRLRKRFGTRYLGNTQQSSRLRIAVGTLNSPTSPVPTGSGSIGQMFSIADVIFYVNELGTPADLLVSNGSASMATFNTSSGVFVFSGVIDINSNPVPGTTTIYFYPALPVMGLITYENAAINNEPTIAFDTKYAYQYNNTTGGFERLNMETNSGDATWTGDNSEFFWGYTWTGTSAADKVLFVTNFNELEPNFMRYLFNSTWTTFRPKITSGMSPIFLNSARILVPFKNRLLAFNTWEGTTSPGSNFQNRVRYSWIGDPTDITNGWLQDVPGKGNALDAPTTEAVITVEFVKDRLIVFFERSTWELVYTGNQAYPFQWQQINTELGAESTFSIVPFDKIAIGVGNVGIHACNGVNVERIDDKIPDSVFQIHNADSGVARVYGIRDYYVEMVYWTFPSPDRSTTFPYPNRVLVYNYKTGTWAFNDDSFTVFGYFQPQTGVTWDSTTVTWDSQITWDSGAGQALFRQVIAGNQEGFVLIVDADQPTNASALQLTDIYLNPPTTGDVTLKVIDHNLQNDDFIYIQNLNGLIGPFLAIYQVDNVIDQDTFTIIAPDIMGVLATGQIYTGGGTIARVSRINILTKQFNFYGKQGRNVYVQKVDFLVDRTDTGALTIDFFTSTANESLVQQGELSGAIVGNNVLETTPYTIYPYEQKQTQLWHPVYFQGDGEYMQLQIYLSDEQMLDFNIMQAPFQLHQMIFHATATASRLQ